MTKNILEGMKPKQVGTVNRYEGNNTFKTRIVYAIEICFEVDSIDEIPSMYDDYIRKEFKLIEGENNERK